MACNFVAVAPNQGCLHIPVEIWRIFFFLTSRFSVHEKKERIFFFLSLDEILLMSNYLTTIDGALVSNSAAAVQNKEESDWELGEEVRGSTGLPRQTEPWGAR